MIGARPLQALLLLLPAVLAGCRSAPVPPASPPPVGAICALPDDRGIGGTGGVGGLATAPRVADRGIGGTGSPVLAAPGAGRTGVFGTITGFGSICVNGLEIRYAPGQTVRLDQTTAPMTALRRGQVVQVEAAGTGGIVSADLIEVAHEVVGPVVAVGPKGETIEVVGQRVLIGPSTAGVGPEGLRRGDWVAVSGLRRNDGTIVATRVDGRQPQAEVTLVGPVEAAGRGRWRIGGIDIVPGAGPMPEPGARVLVRGRLRGDVVAAEQVEDLPLLPSPGRVGRFSIQAYVLPRDGRVSLGSGGSLPLARGLSGEVTPGLGILDAVVGADREPVVEAFRALRSAEPGEGQGDALQEAPAGEATSGRDDRGEGRSHESEGSDGSGKGGGSDDGGSDDGGSGGGDSGGGGGDNGGGGGGHSDD